MALSFVVPRASERESESNMWYYTPTFWNSRSYDNDETDNKTSEEVPLYVVKAPIYRMNDIFHREDERRKTFDKWPHDFIDKNQLAQTGMFFTGEDDKVKCYFCEVEIGEWQREDQPVAEHIRFSHNCPLLRRRTTNNVPISAEALDRALPPISYDICGANDAIEVRPHAYAEGTIAAPRMMTSTAINASGLYGLAAAQAAGCSGAPQPMNYFPEFPEYAIEAARKRSFAEWPRHMNQKPEQLAEAGFFYTGIGDRVKCFSCGGGLKDWDISDEPWEQHALWLGRCRFLKLMKGQNFIDAVLSKQKEKDSPSSADESSEAIVARAALSGAAPESAATAAVQSSVAEQQQVVSTSINAPADTCRALSSDALQHEANVEEAATAPVAAPAAAAPAAAAASGGDRRAPPAIAEEKLCKICYAAEYNTAFLPCGHVVACAKCASSVTKCPLCRKPFTDVMRVYFS